MLINSRQPWEVWYGIPASSLLNEKASIGLICYTNYRGVPEINSRLTNIVNDMGYQWIYGQAVWIAMPGNANAETTIGDF